MGEWSVREIGGVRGFGGSTGCPECKVVSTIGKKAEKECQNACNILFSYKIFFKILSNFGNLLMESVEQKGGRGRIV